MTTFETAAAATAYPGRGIMLGVSADGARAVICYFIMGRSEHSRNRVFELTADGVRTRAWDESKVVDPSLIIYAIARDFGGATIVTNGDQTDTIRDFLARGLTFEDALRTREYEPDGPNWTPRISGILRVDGGAASYKMAILKKGGRNFFEPDSAPGLGHYIHTYMGDGAPLPSFEGEPERVDISASCADSAWESLNQDNRVALYWREIDLKSGETVAERIINKHGGRA